MKRKGHAALIAIVFAGFFITTLAGTARASIKPAAVSQTLTDVLVFMQAGNTPFSDRIKLDGRLNITYEYEGSVAQIKELDHFQVYVVCGYLPSNSTYIGYLNSNITAGKGLFIFGGYYPIFAQSNTQYDALKTSLPVVFKEPFTVEEELYLNQDWVSQIELKVNSIYGWSDSETSANKTEILQRSVVWESSPLVKERIFVKDARPDSKVLVYKPEQNRASSLWFQEGEPLVAFRQQGFGKILWVSMVVGPTTALFAEYITQGAGPYWERVERPGTARPIYVEANKPFYLWPYFNYFVFQSIRYLSNEFSYASEIDTYAQWPHSPIPHETEATIWMIFVAGLWVFNFVLFFTLGKKKKSASRETLATEPAVGGEKELTAEEQKALETPKIEGKAWNIEESKPDEDEKK